jgi:hypothetical protein
MTDATLRSLRQRIESLAGGGRFRVVCARTGTEPTPAVGLRFPSRRAAADAARLTGRYRATLRRWDPALAWCDPIAHEAGVGPARATAADARRTQVEGEP